MSLTNKIFFKKQQKHNYNGVFIPNKNNNYLISSSMWSIFRFVAKWLLQLVCWIALSLTRVSLSVEKNYRTSNDLLLYCISHFTLLPREEVMANHRILYMQCRKTNLCFDNLLIKFPNWFFFSLNIYKC